MATTLAPLPPTFTATRLGLHAVAERVLAPLLRATTGHIGLRARAGGFGLPGLPDGRVVTVVGDQLHDGDRHQTITTLAAAMAFLGSEPGDLSDLYAPETDADPERPLHVDAAAGTAIGAWFTLGAEVLAAVLAQATPEDAAADVQLWPEHFDLATDLGPDGQRATVGFSPGDAEHPEPYLYLSLWEPRTGPFWNEPFGASLPYAGVLGGADPLAFVAEGRSLLA